MDTGDETAMTSIQRRPVIALLTDFGQADGYVGVMKGVMLGIAPDATLVDLSHEVPPQDVATGAWLLHTAWRSFPAGTVFLCVVDPGVGSDRRPIALHMADRYFVGPDNGLFSYILPSAEVAVVLDDPRYHLPQTSATFHGRDIFAPCAAWLARMTPLTALGSSLPVADLVTLDLPEPFWQDGELIGRILHIDHYGNLITSFGPDMAVHILASKAATLHVGARRITARASHFAAGPEGAPFLLRDSSGHLAIAVRNGNAAVSLNARQGQEVRMTGRRKRETL